MLLISIYIFPKLQQLLVNSPIIKIVTISIIEIVEKRNHFFIKKVLNRKSTILSTINSAIYKRKIEFSTFSTDFNSQGL